MIKDWQVQSAGVHASKLVPPRLRYTVASVGPIEPDSAPSVMSLAQPAVFEKQAVRLRPWLFSEKKTMCD
jgi:hypothetical protein